MTLTGYSLTPVLEEDAIEHEGKTDNEETRDCTDAPNFK